MPLPLPPPLGAIEGAEYRYYAILLLINELLPRDFGSPNIIGDLVPRSAAIVSDRGGGKARARRKRSISAGGEKVERQSFWNDDTGQDLIEYTLLLSMVCLASAALVIGSGGAVSGIWHTTNNNLSAAHSVAVR